MNEAINTVQEIAYYANNVNIEIKGEFAGGETMSVNLSSFRSNQESYQTSVLYEVLTILNHRLRLEHEYKINKEKDSV